MHSIFSPCQYFSDKEEEKAAEGLSTSWQPRDPSGSLPEANPKSVGLGRAEEEQGASEGVRASQGLFMGPWGWSIPCRFVMERRTGDGKSWHGND